jgi:cell division protein FtsZ
VPVQRPMAAPASAPMAAAMPAPASMPAPTIELAVPVAVEAEPALPIMEAAPQSRMAEDAARAVESARAETTPEAFIPPAPVEVSASAHESRGSAASITPRPLQARNRVSSLLSRIRGNEDKAPAAKPAPAINPPAHPAEPVKAVEPEQPSLGLGGLDARERIRGSQTEEDLLEIPAFLRRQAN